MSCNWHRSLLIPTLSVSYFGFKIHSRLFDPISTLSVSIESPGPGANVNMCQDVGSREKAEILQGSATGNKIATGEMKIRGKDLANFAFPHP